MYSLSVGCFELAWFAVCVWAVLGGLGFEFVGTGLAGEGLASAGVVRAAVARSVRLDASSNMQRKLDCLSTATHVPWLLLVFGELQFEYSTRLSCLLCLVRAEICHCALSKLLLRAKLRRLSLYISFHPRSNVPSMKILSINCGLSLVRVAVNLLSLLSRH